MSRISWSRSTVTVVIAVVVVVVGVGVGLLVGGGGHSPSKTSLSPSASVLNASYATSVGFPKTYRAAKSTKVTDSPGCSATDEAVYEDAKGETAIISDELTCQSTASAATALAAARKGVQTDSDLKPPSALGSSAFGTASNDPEYLVAWQSGSRVAIVAIDVNVKATSSTSAPRPLTGSQEKTLMNAALEQNSLYN